MLFIQTLWTNPVYFCMVCLIVTFSVCVHEYFHAQMAVWEGDYTLRDHLTLNPMKQMGVMSLVMMAFFGIAWGGVPVDPSLLRRRWSMLLVSAAGPFANFVLFLTGAVLFGLCYRFSGGEGNENVRLLQFMSLFGIYNFVLFVFNLIPAPGLDGWHILSSIFPKLNTVSSEVIKGFMLFLMLLAFFAVRFIFIIGSLLVNNIAGLVAGAGAA